jgi:hypothetical protein
MYITFPYPDGLTVIREIYPLFEASTGKADDIVGSDIDAGVKMGAS